MLGVLASIQEPCPPHPSMPWMRDPTKGKGVAPLAALTEVPLGENPDAALACQLQQEEQKAETVWRGEDPNPSIQPRGQPRLQRSVWEWMQPP